MMQLITILYTIISFTFKKVIQRKIKQFHQQNIYSVSVFVLFDNASVGIDNHTRDNSSSIVNNTSERYEDNKITYLKKHRETNTNSDIHVTCNISLVIRTVDVISIGLFKRTVSVNLIKRVMI